MTWYPFLCSHNEDHFCKKSWGFINFSQRPCWSFDIQTIKLFSFEGNRVIILVSFSLLQLLSGLALSDPSLSIILHAIREMLYHPFHLCKTLHLFSSFAVSFCNQIAIYLCWVLRCLSVAQQKYGIVHIERRISSEEGYLTGDHQLLKDRYCFIHISFSSTMDMNELMIGAQ